MNLDTTIAVTQNFCSLTNLPRVWPKTVKGRPKFTKHWLRVLSKDRPEVVAMIESMDRSGITFDSVSSDSSSSSSSESDSSSDSDSGAEAEYTGAHASSSGTNRKRCAGAYPD